MLMCLAIPSKVVKIKGQWANVESGEHEHRVNLALVKNVKLGDYLLIHDQLAINKLPKKEAEKIIKMVQNHH